MVWEYHIIDCQYCGILLKLQKNSQNCLKNNLMENDHAGLQMALDVHNAPNFTNV